MSWSFSDHCAVPLPQMNTGEFSFRAVHQGFDRRSPPPPPRDSTFWGIFTKMIVRTASKFLYFVYFMVQGEISIRIHGLFKFYNSK